MREIPAALSASSSSSQQNIAAENSYENKQGQSTLLNEISTLRSRLRELNDGDPSPTDMNHLDTTHRRPGSAFTDGGRREPPAQFSENDNEESALVIKLRKDLTKLEQEKAEMELTLMNQMSNLAFENQTTIDSLHARLAQSEKALKEKNPASSAKSASSEAELCIQRLRKSLNEERGVRRALEEERDVRNKEFQRVREEREFSDAENSKLTKAVEKMKEQINVLESSNMTLSTERDEASLRVQSLQSALDTSTNAHEGQISALVAKHKTALADTSLRHQAQMQELKQNYQQRCNQLEKEMAQTVDKKEAGVASLHTKIAALEAENERCKQAEKDVSQKFEKRQAGITSMHNKIAELDAENENLVHSVAELQKNLDQEQVVVQQLEQSLEEQNKNNSKLWTSLEASQNRCSMLEKEIPEKFASSRDSSDLQKENEALLKLSADLKKEKETLAKEATSAQEQLAAEKETCIKLQSSLDAERSTSSKLKLSLRQHQHRYAELNQNLHKNQSGMGLVNNKLVSLEKDKKTLTVHVVQLREQLGKDQAKIKDLEAAISEKQKALDENLQNNRRRQTDAAALENAQLELQSVLNSYQSDMARLERKVQASEQQLSERNRQNQRLEVEINEERRIRKSLTAQLSQAKLANKQQKASGPIMNGNSNLAASKEAAESELEKLRKENARLNDELKLQARRTSVDTDPTEVEFLRKQNKMLGDCANGNADQLKELETLREKNKTLNDELIQLRATSSAASAPPSRCSSPSFLRRDLKAQNELRAELECLKKENGVLSKELESVKHQLASPTLEKTQVLNRYNKPAASGLNGPPPSPQRRIPRSSSDRAPRSPKPKKEGSLSGMQTPPLSPPLHVRTKKPLRQDNPTTPAVKGLVESFERRISRTSSNSSFLAAAAEAAEAAHSPPSPPKTIFAQHLTSNSTSHSLPSTLRANQAQGAQSSELDDIRRELHEERATVQDLRSKLKAESDMVQSLRCEISLLEESDTKRKELEQALQHKEEEITRMQSVTKKMEQHCSEITALQEQSESKQRQLERTLGTRDQDIVRLRSQANGCDEKSQEITKLRKGMEQYRVTVTELRTQLNTETAQANKLRIEQSKMQQTEAKRSALEKSLQAREAEVLKLRAKVTELEDVALEMSNTHQLAEQEKATSQRLQNQLSTESGLVASLQKQVSMTEEKMERESATAENLRTDLKKQSDLVATLQDQLSSEAERVASLQTQLTTEKEKMAKDFTTVQNLEAFVQTQSERVGTLQNEVNSEKELAASLQKQLRMAEEKMAQETAVVQSLQNDLKTQSERVATLQHELTEAEEKYEKEKAKAEDLQTNLSAEIELAAAQRSAMAESEAMRKESNAAVLQREEEIQRLSRNLSAELGRVAGLQNDLNKLSEAESKRAEEHKHGKETETQQLRSRVGELEMLLASATTQTTDEAEVEKLRGELAQADSARKGFEAKLFEERATTEKVKAESARVDEQLQLRTLEAQQLHADIVSYKASIEKMARTKREDEDLIERLQTELGAARMGLERSLDEMEKMTNNSQKSSQQDAESSQRDQEEIKRLKGELIVVKQALDVNVEEMAKLQKCVKDADASRMIAVRQSMTNQQEGQQAVAQLKAELAKKMESSNQGQEEEINRLRSQVAALQTELGEALASVESLKAALSNIQSAHDSQLQDAHKNQRRASQSIGAEMKTLQVELTKNQLSKADMEVEYTNRIQDLESKIQVMQIEMDQAGRVKESQLNQVQFKLARKEEEVRQLEKERLQICSSMNNISSTRKDEFDELNEEVMNLTAKTASQTRQIEALNFQLQEHDYRRSEFERLNNRIEELEDELREVPPQRRSDILSPSDVEIIKRENMLLRESVRDVTMERRSLQEKLESMLADRTSSRSTQVLRERNAALKKEVERLTKRLKKMENNMTRFAI